MVGAAACPALLRDSRVSVTRAGQAAAPTRSPAVGATIDRGSGGRGAGRAHRRDQHRRNPMECRYRLQAITTPAAAPRKPRRCLPVGWWRLTKEPALAAALLDARGAAGQPPQVVELGAADAAGARHLDLLDARGMDEEGALDADAVGGDAAHREVLVDAAAAAANDDALEDLNALPVPLDHLGVDTNRVARAELGDVLLELL